MPIDRYVPSRLGEGYFSDVPAPSPGNNGMVLKYDSGTGTFVYDVAGAPGGSTTQVQFNNAGAFAGDAGMTYDAATDRLTVAGGLVAPSIRPASDSTTALQWQNAAGTAVAWLNTVNSRLEANGIMLADSRILRLGTDSDIQFYHDGTTGLFFNSTGQFQFRNESASQVQFFTTGINRFSIDAQDSGSSAISSNTIIRHTTSGTPGAGFGTAIRTLLKSSTNNDQNAGRIVFKWGDATHATRASIGQLSAYYTSTEHFPITWGANSSGALVSFYNVTTPIARQLLALGCSNDDIANALNNLGLTRLS